MDVINNLEHRQQWIDALKSGKYKKGEGRLKTNDNCYCCLGVLAELNNDLDENNCFKGFSVALLRNHTAGLIRNLNIPSSHEYNHYGLNEDIQNKLATINDDYDTFEPVIEAIKAL